MKKIFFYLLVAAFCTGVSAQELDSLKAIMGNKNAPDKSENRNDETTEPVIIDDDDEEVSVKIRDREFVKVTENGDSTYVRVGNKGVLQVIDQPDSTTIRVGDKEIRIVEKNNDTDIHFGDLDDNNNHDLSKSKFRGHWSGFEWGVNNFLDAGNSISRGDEDWFMDLNTGRSWAINLNFAQFSMGFGTSHFGILSGLGLEFSNYFFDNDITILEGPAEFPDGPSDYVIPDSLFGSISKSKLSTTFLRVPLILEVQFPNTSRSRRVFLSAGVVGGLKLGSHTKVVSKDDGGKNKDKNRDDFNINPFRYGITARFGIGNMSVFGDYYFTTMFVEDKGPELHPFSVGMAFNF